MSETPGDGGIMPRPNPAADVMVQAEIQRAVAELHAHMTYAANRPRDEQAVAERVLRTCDNVALAEIAVYEFARGGTEIRGLSVKMVQAIARLWGNVISGIKELQRANGYSVINCYAWDLETGYGDERVITVRHWRDTRSGGYPLRDERDINELIANQGQRRKRAVMETVLPPELLEAAYRRCEGTVMKSADLTPAGIEKLLAAFDEFGVTRAHIEALIQRSLGAMTPRQYLRLRKAYVALRDGIATVEELFGQPRAPQGASPPPMPTNAPRTGRERARETVKQRGKPKPAPDDGGEPDPFDSEAPQRQRKDGDGARAEGEGDAPLVKLAALRAEILACELRDDAALVMDRARALSQPEYDALRLIFEQRFPEED